MVFLSITIMKCFAPTWQQALVWQHNSKDGYGWLGDIGIRDHWIPLSPKCSNVYLWRLAILNQWYNLHSFKAKPKMKTYMIIIFTHINIVYLDMAKFMQHSTVVVHTRHKSTNQRKRGRKILLQAVTIRSPYLPGLSVFCPSGLKSNNHSSPSPNNFGHFCWYGRT